MIITQYKGLKLMIFDNLESGVFIANIYDIIMGYVSYEGKMR